MAISLTGDPPKTQENTRVNVRPQERWASVVGGSLLTLWGIKRGSLPGLGLAALGGSLLYRGATGHCPTYARMGIDTAGGSAARITEALTVDRPRDDLYRFWRDMENLPAFMRHLESVRKMDERRSVWTARGPKGIGTVNWEAEITEDVPGERIAWRSLPGADIDNSGEVRFEDAIAGRGTIVQIHLEYQPSASLTGAAAGLVNPLFSRILREDLRRFKSLMEAGEVPTLEGQPKGH